MIESGFKSRAGYDGACTVCRTEQDGTARPGETQFLVPGKNRLL